MKHREGPGAKNDSFHRPQSLLRTIIVDPDPPVLQMSSSSLLEVECPSCRAKQDILIWNTITITREPEIKEQLVTGRINYFTCSTCDFEGFITAPLAYEDPEKKICVHYLPVEYLEDGEYLKRSFTPDAKINPGLHTGTAGTRDTTPARNVHIVFSMEEMIRYVLFRDRLDQVFASTGPE